MKWSLNVAIYWNRIGPVIPNSLGQLITDRSRFFIARKMTNVSSMLSLAGKVWALILDDMKQKFALHRLIKLKQRYILTRGNRLRLRYVAGTAVCLLFVGALALQDASSLSMKWQGSVVQSFVAQSSQESDDSAFSHDDRQKEDKAFGDESGDVSMHENLAFAAEDERSAQDDSRSINNLINETLRNQVSDGIRRAASAMNKTDKPLSHEIRVGSGDTLAGLMGTVGVSSGDTHNAIKALSKDFNPRHVKPGQVIQVNFKPGDEPDSDPVFSDMVVKIDPVKEVIVAREGDGFKSEIHERELQQKVYAGHTEIQTSLYGSAARAGIPSHIIADMIKVYSWDVDFQRDIRQGDKIEVLYNVYETEDGKFAKYGDVLYANLSVAGRDIPIYRYEMDEGRVDYFGPDGKSVRKTLMKTPIDGARISSGFGMRKHPVLGYNKMHKGVDFAAPTGTPIYAAGDGKIEYAGRNGGYGNYARIRHNSSLKTAYAHMHKLKVKKGQYVRQGDVIGYVGTTGRSTGPHLHYEVLMNSKQVNPNRVDLPVGEQLKGKAFDKFKGIMVSLNQQYASLVDGMKFAMHTP